MISRPPKENRARRRRLGAGGSLALHLLLAFLFVLLAPLFPKPETETRSSSPEIVTITHRPRHPRAAAQPPPAVAAHPPSKTVVVTRAAPPPVPHPQAALPKPAVAPRVAQATAPPKTVHRSKRPAAVAAAPREAPVAQPGTAARSTYSRSRIDQIEHDLAQSIAAQRSGINPTAVGTSEPAPEMKQYGPSIAAFDIGDARTHHGLCDPIKDWVANGYDYYYVACNVRFSDGTMQRESVPWPVRFEPADDPFSGTAGKDLPLAMPLPGWKVEPGSYVSKELREYAHDHGVDI
jgi:hypothetical protein